MMLSICENSTIALKTVYTIKKILKVEASTYGCLLVPVLKYVNPSFEI